MNIRIDIERLILEGMSVEPAKRAMLKAEVERELARLLSISGLSSSLRAGGAIPDIRAGSIRGDTANDPSRLGRQIARAVFGGLAGGKRK